MLLNTYNSVFQKYFTSPRIQQGIEDSVKLLQEYKRIFFIGNGGSNSICSHMYEDFGKMGRFHTYAFSDPALITCYANDYGYENALVEWLKLYFDKESLLIAISSSGNSANIINAADYAIETGGKVISLSGFSPDNKLNQRGDIRFHVAENSFGLVECFHQVILHVILDEYMLTRP